MTEMLSQVTVRQGKVEGGFDNSVHHFLGLPYAAPPIEERRWRAPEPPSNWAGIRSATRFGPACLQTVGAVFNLRAEQDEDCLYLNIWTSSLVREAKQPVMV